MVKIFEFQCVSEDIKNCQSRTIEYSSWQDYIKDIQIIDGMVEKMPYQTIPRQTQIMNVILTDDEIKYEFHHRVIKKTVYGCSTLLKE